MYEREAEGMLVINIPVDLWKELLDKKQKIKIVIEYTLNDSLQGLRFEKYYDYPSAVLKEYAYTESYVLINNKCSMDTLSIGCHV